MPSGFIFPSVNLKEIDLTTGAKLFETSIAGAILVSRQGDESDRYITRVEVFDAVYGRPDPTWSFGHYCIRKYLSKGKGIWIKRISKNARHAGAIVFNDRNGSQATQTYHKAFKSGRYEDYKGGSQQLLNYKFSAELVTGNSVTFIYADNPDGNNPRTVTTTFTDSNDNTLDLLTKAITTSINTDLPLGKASGFAFVNRIGASSSNDRIITVVAPEDQLIYVQDISVSGGSSQPEAEEFSDSTVLEVYAQNRGKWGSDIGYRFLNPSIGINQRLQVAIDTPLVANQRINARIYYRNSVTGEETDTTLAPTVFATSHALTMQAFADKVKAALGDQSDVYFDDGDTTKLAFTVVSPSDGPNTIEFKAIEVENTSGNAALPNFFINEVMAGYDGDQTFDIQVYHRSNLNEPLETRTVSLVRQPDGDGNPLYIEDVINNNDSTKSDYIRVKFNSVENGSAQLNIPADGTPIYFLNGGDDGQLPTTGDIVLAWDAFKSRQTRPMRLLINCGHTALAVHQKMTNVAKKRFDCIAILDFPSDKQAAQTVFVHRNTNMNLDSNYNGLFTPDVKELDPFRNTELFVPPSGHIAAQFAETDAVAAEWFAMAGLNRGVLDTALDLRHEYDEEEAALIVSAQVNPIIKRGGVIVCWDQITTQRRQSAFKNISLRRLLIRVEVSIVDGLDYSLHEPNDDYTAMAMVQVCVGVLTPIRDGRGLYGFAAISDDRNNKNYDYDNQQRNIDVILDPILPIRNIRLSAVVTKKGASFSETVTAINGGSSNLGA